MDTNASRSPKPSRKKGASTGNEAPGRYAVAPSNTGTGSLAEPPPPRTSAPPTTTVTATDAARRFSDLVSRACYQGETFLIERGGRPVCQLGPVETRRCTGADLLALLTRLPRPDEEYLAAVERYTREQPVVEPSPWER